MKKKIILAAGTGFLGQCIIKHLHNDYKIVVLTRNVKSQLPIANCKLFQWDAKTIGKWSEELEGAFAVINLAGKSVDCRYNEKNKKEIFDSRTDSTKAIGKAIQNCKEPPKIWINSASATIYRHAEDRPMDEIKGERGNGFSVEVCKKWEETFNEVVTPQTRKIILRIAMVLGNEGGVFPVLKRLVKFGLGGKQGNGNQYMSWVHEYDFVNCIKFIFEHDNISGVYNCAAPGPLPNKDFMKIIRSALNVKIGLPANKLMLEVGAVFLRTETELILKSRRVVPTKLLQSGFKFKFEKVSDAINDLVSPNNKI
ncbi:MAG: TIGR01777 family oxidoreductase [Bacteroidia bacterium]